MPCLLFLHFPLYFHRRNKKKEQGIIALDLFFLFSFASVFPFSHGHKRQQGGSDQPEHPHIMHGSPAWSHSCVAEYKDWVLGFLAAPWASCSTGQSASPKAETHDTSVMFGWTQRKDVNVVLKEPNPTDLLWEPNSSFNELLKKYYLSSAAQGCPSVAYRPVFEGWAPLSIGEVWLHTFHDGLGVSAVVNPLQPTVPFLIFQGTCPLRQT